MSEEELLLQNLGDALNRALVGGASYSGVALDGAKIHLRIEDESSRQPETRLWSVQTDFWVELEHIAEIAALAILAADAADVRLEVTTLYDGSPAADEALDAAENDHIIAMERVLSMVRECESIMPRFGAYWNGGAYRTSPWVNLFSPDGEQWFHCETGQPVDSSEFAIQFHGGQKDRTTKSAATHPRRLRP